MKNHGLLWMSSLAFLFFACSNDQDVKEDQGLVKKGEPAVLSIRLSGETGGTKAVGTPDPADEAKVNDGIIYVFNSSGIVVKKAFFASGEFTGTSKSKQVETTTEAASVSVLLNAGISDSTSMAGSRYDVVNKSQLEALTQDLALSSGTGVATQVSNNLLMSGVSAGTISFLGIPKTAEVAVTVSRIVSKITIDWSFEPNSAFVDKIELVGAVVLNVPLTSKLFGATLTMPTPKYLEGLAADVLSSFPDGGYKPDAADMISNVGLLSVSDFQVPRVQPNYFYVFENGSVSATIVAIVANYNDQGIGNAEGTTYRKYYPVVINNGNGDNQDNSKTIKRNVAYNVKATVKGVGVDNPFNPVDPASLTVNITVADWAVVLVGQTFE